MRASNLIFLSSASTAAATLCPFLGPVFPPPKTLTSDALFLTGLRQSIESALLTGTTLHGPVSSNDTYSIQIFSTSDNGVPLLDFHHRGTSLVGNDTLNGDSIYRIASVTKVLTVYLLLLAEAGDGILSDLVVKYLPELKGKGVWDEITVGDLAGYMSGIVGDVYDTDLISDGGLKALLPDAFPPLDTDEKSPCAYGRSGCTREVFLNHIATRKQVFLPKTTPAYSNAGYAVLGLILEAATGRSYDDNLSMLLNAPLGLRATSATTPSSSERGVIVGSESAVRWDTIIDGAGTAMGAAYSSANDMSAISRAILSSSLLPDSTTRAWLKPTSQTSSLIGAVGQPWEMFRATLGPEQNNRVVDLYTKGGNFGGYGTNLVLIPDFEVGFVALQAGRVGRVPVELSGLIVDDLLPAVEEVARVEADAAFAGTYSASGGLNSTVKLTTTSGISGLTLEQWVSNNTDILRDGFGSPEHFQLYPTNVKDKDGTKSSWRSTYISVNDVGAFSACPSWFGVDRPTYGIYGLDDFVFHVDGSGRAKAIEIPALKVVLQRQ